MHVYAYCLSALILARSLFSSFCIIHPTAFVAYRLSLSVGNASISHFALIFYEFLLKRIYDITERWNQSARLFSFTAALSSGSIHRKDRMKSEHFRNLNGKHRNSGHVWNIFLADLCSGLNTFACSIDTNGIAADSNSNASLSHHNLKSESVSNYILKRSHKVDAIVLSFHSEWNVYCMQKEYCNSVNLYTCRERRWRSASINVTFISIQMCGALSEPDRERYMVAQWMRLYSESTVFYPNSLACSLSCETSGFRSLHQLKCTFCQTSWTELIWDFLYSLHARRFCICFYVIAAQDTKQ